MIQQSYWVADSSCTWKLDVINASPISFGWCGISCALMLVRCQRRIHFWWSHSQNWLVHQVLPFPWPNPLERWGASVVPGWRWCSRHWHRVVRNRGRLISCLLLSHHWDVLFLLVDSEVLWLLWPCWNWWWCRTIQGSCLLQWPYFSFLFILFVCVDF